MRGHARGRRAILRGVKSYTMYFLASAAFFAMACEPDSTPTPAALEQSDQSVVYGDDDRLDWYQVEDPDQQEFVRNSIVALVNPNALDETDPNDIGIVAQTLGQRRGLCEDQLFRDQPNAASCSGTLIDDDLVLTAGHCISSQESCNNRRFVFNYRMESENERAAITADDVYSCARIVHSVDANGVDYALVQLDRPVVPPRAPAGVRRLDVPFELDADMTLIGFPSGIPVKVAANGRVVDPRGDTLDYFEATVDAFGGNSGSGVFDADGNVAGILVRGEQDYTARDGCTVVNVLGEDRQDAEDVTYASRAIERLCSHGYESERLCGGGDRGLCYLCEEDTDCREGWTCNQFEDRDDLTFCSPPCDGDDECRGDHTCVEGRCAPRRTTVCVGNDVFDADGCGRQLDLIQACGETQFCRAGTCNERLPGDVCATAEELTPEDQTLTGQLNEGFANDYGGSCGGGGPDRVYAFTLEREMTLRATARGFDTVLHIRRDCDDGQTELDCDDDSDPPGDRGSQLNIERLEVGRWFLFLEGFRADTGDFQLDLDFGIFCEVDCQPGEMQCGVGETMDVCVEGNDGCNTWSPVDQCPEGLLCQDLECVEAAAGDSCDNPTVIEPEFQTLRGDLNGAFRASEVGSCGGEGRDRVFQFELAQMTRVTVVAGGFDTVLHMRTVCDDPQSELTCNDDDNDPRGDRGSTLQQELGPGIYYVFMDSFRRAGQYNISFQFETLCPEACTDGDTRCTENGRASELCGTDENGCVTWITSDCEDDAACQDGACAKVCDHDCDELGIIECMSDTAYGVCGQYDADPCREWSVTSECGEELVCADGACVDAPIEPEPEMDAGNNGIFDDTGNEGDTPAPPPPPARKSGDGCGCF
jgi:V8-like Glu-specific endopeptidase